MDHDDITKAAVFLSQSTQGEKLSVCDTSSAIVFEVTWCISPLLSLQTYQKMKLKTGLDLNDIAFTAINLDD